VRSRGSRAAGLCTNFEHTTAFVRGRSIRPELILSAELAPPNRFRGVSSGERIRNNTGAERVRVMRYSATPLRPHIGHVVANPPYSTERRRDGCRVNVTLLKHEPMFVYHMPDSMYELQSTFERLFHEERNHRNITDLLAGKPEELVHKDLTKYEDVAEKMRIGYVWNGTVRAPPVLDDEGLARATENAPCQHKSTQKSRARQRICSHFRIL
jgi:hypothetical protein